MKNILNKNKQNKYLIYTLLLLNNNVFCTSYTNNRKKKPNLPSKNKISSATPEVQSVQNEINSIVSDVMTKNNIPDSSKDNVTNTILTVILSIAGVSSIIYLTDRFIKKNENRIKNEAEKKIKLAEFKKNENEIINPLKNKLENINTFFNDFFIMQYYSPEYTFDVKNNKTSINFSQNNNGDKIFGKSAFGLNGNEKSLINNLDKEFGIIIPLNDDGTIDPNGIIKDLRKEKNYSFCLEKKLQEFFKPDYNNKKASEILPLIDKINELHKKSELVSIPLMQFSNEYLLSKGILIQSKNGLSLDPQKIDTLNKLKENYFNLYQYSLDANKLLEEINGINENNSYESIKALEAKVNDYYSNMQQEKYIAPILTEHKDLLIKYKEKIPEKRTMMHKDIASHISAIQSVISE